MFQFKKRAKRRVEGQGGQEAQFYTHRENCLKFKIRHSGGRGILTVWLYGLGTSLLSPLSLQGLFFNLRSGVLAIDAAFPHHGTVYAASL